MDRIDLGDGAIRFEDGHLLHLVWNRGVRIEAGNARAAMEAVNRLAGGRMYPLLVDIAATKFLSHHAREVFAQPCAASRIASLGAGPVDRMLVNYQLSTGQVPCPTRFFTSKADALAWLDEPDQTTDTPLPATSCRLLTASLGNSWVFASRCGLYPHCIRRGGVTSSLRGGSTPTGCPGSKAIDEKEASFKNFQLGAIVAEVERREKAHNGGRQYEPLRQKPTPRRAGPLAKATADLLFKELNEARRNRPSEGLPRFE